jgi:hypothetical protein
LFFHILSPWFKFSVVWPVFACTLLSVNRGVKRAAPA